MTKDNDMAVVVCLNYTYLYVGTYLIHYSYHLNLSNLRFIKLK